MKTEIIKELRFALRSGRIIIILASFLFFSLLTPVMLKVILPMVLSSQFAGEASQSINNLTNMTQLDCIRNYMNDIVQIGTIIVAFTLCGLTAAEIRDNTWVLPLCAGKSFGRLIAAKLIVFGVLLVVASTLAMVIDYAYSGILFGFEIGIQPILYVGLMQGVYMLFLISCLAMWGVFLKKPIPAGFMALITVFGIHFISSLFSFAEWTPSGLLIIANRLTTFVASDLFIPLGITMLIISIVIAITLMRLKRMEWNMEVS